MFNVCEKMYLLTLGWEFDICICNHHTRVLNTTGTIKDDFSIERGIFASSK